MKTSLLSVLTISLLAVAVILVTLALRPAHGACLGFAACDNMPTGGPYRAINQDPATGRTFARDADYVAPQQPAKVKRVKVRR
jgi:hypothetical protein